jgi:hypothetical protein
VAGFFSCGFSDASDELMMIGGQYTLEKRL